MNDFTKDELELTLSLYNEFMKKYEFSEDVETIVDKLQSLIDNYCKHPSVTPCPDCISVECDKCGKHMSGNADE